MAATSFFGGAFFGGGFFAPVLDGGGVHRKLRNIANMGQVRGESEDDKLARRIREGTIPAPVVAPVEPKQDEYTAKSAKLAAGIAQFRAEALQHREAIARLEAVQIKRQTQKLQRDLIRAQQALQLAQVREAVLLEEMEVIDIAFIAKAVIGMVLQ